MPHDRQGREIPDPVPIAVPAGLKRPESLTEQIRRLIRVDMSQQAQDNGEESFEEANDFDIDDEDPEATFSKYEISDMAPEVLNHDADAAPRDRTTRRTETQDDDDDGEAPDHPDPSDQVNESRDDGDDPPPAPRAVPARPNSRPVHNDRKKSSGDRTLRTPTKRK